MHYACVRWWSWLTFKPYVLQITHRRLIEALYGARPCNPSKEEKTNTLRARQLTYGILSWVFCARVNWISSSSYQAMKHMECLVKCSKTRPNVLWSVIYHKIGCDKMDWASLCDNAGSHRVICPGHAACYVKCIVNRRASALYKTGSQVTQREKLNMPVVWRNVRDRLLCFLRCLKK